MPITFSCACGRTLRVPDLHAGKRVKCPACKGVATVPEAEPEPMFEVVEDPSEPLVAPPAPSASVPRKPVTARVAEDDDDDDDRRGYGVSKSRRDDDDEEDRPRPKKRKIKARRRTARSDYDRSENSNNSSASREIAGGLFAMVGAVVWFVLGLMNDWVFFYPPILFVFGLIGVIKGLAGGSGEH